MNRGGKIISPIREMMESDFYDGVSFQCSDRDDVEKTRIKVIIAKHRNNLDIKTHSDGKNNLIVYKQDADIYGEGFLLEEDLTK